MRDEIESRSAQPADHLLAGNAETAMRMFVAQALKFMRGEIDDQQSSAWAQYARSFGEGAARLIEIVKDLVNGDKIDTVIGKRKCKDIAMAYLQVAQFCLFDRGAGDRQHLAA